MSSKTHFITREAVLEAEHYLLAEDSIMEKTTTEDIVMLGAYREGVTDMAARILGVIKEEQ